MITLTKTRIIAVVFAAVFLFAIGIITAYAKDGAYEPETESSQYNMAGHGYSHADFDTVTAPSIIPETLTAQPLTPQPLTPPGTGTVVDNVTNENGIEFFTITSANGNIFFLIIDRQRDMENVYFLNAVTERDLLALAEESGDTWEMTSTPPPIIPGTPTVPEVEVVTEPEHILEPEPVQSGGMGMIVLLIILALGGGAAGYYFKIYRPQQQQSNTADEFDYEDEDAYGMNDDTPPWDAEGEDNKDGED